MDLFVLILSFFVMLFLGIPIAFALCLSSLLYMVLYSSVPLIIIGQQMLKGVDSFTLLAIPFFIIAGSLMTNGGISKRIVNFAKQLVGWMPGGLAVVDIVASMIFAAMTGAGAATTAAVGGMMIPHMEEEGYDPGFASAIQAMGGVFGPIIPPSTLMVLYAVAFVKATVDAFWALLAPIIILGGIYSGIMTPTESSAVCCFYCMIVGLFIYRELSVKDLVKVVAEGVKSSAGIMLIVAATQVFGWVLTRAQIPQTIAKMFTENVSNGTVFLFAVCLILLVAGCFIDAVPALLIFAPIFCPTAQAYGLNMVHFGVVMVVVLCIGLATPPVGINLYVASSVGGQPVHKIIPHLPIPLLTIAIATIVLILCPPIVTLLPTLFG